jgi:hypothetical protein
VTVLAGTVPYVTGRKPEAYRGRFLVRETVPGGVRVLRCHVSEQYNVSFLRPGLGLRQLHGFEPLGGAGGRAAP